MITLRLLTILVVFLSTGLYTAAQKDISTNKHKSDQKKEKTINDSSSIESQNKQLGKTVGVLDQLIDGNEPDSIKESRQIITLKKEIEWLQKLNMNLKERIDDLENENLTLLHSLEKEQESNSSGSSLLTFIKKIIGISFVLFSLVVVVWFIMKKKKSQKQKPVILKQKKKYDISPPPVQNTTKNIASEAGNKLKHPAPSTVLSPAEYSFSNIGIDSFIKSSSPKYYVAAASAIGKLHVTNGKPCQDSHRAENLGSGWGIAIIADGAGSAEHSDIGSKFVVDNASGILKNIIEKESWYRKDKLPEDHEWALVGLLLLKNIYTNLEQFAKDKKYVLPSLACTLIVVVFSDKGLLTMHIGDGRAGYRNSKGEWKSIMKPHKGEESNHTIFITSNNWQTEANFQMSDVNVPECRVIRDAPSAFTLLTDGCESHSFECSLMDDENKKWHDPNKPFSKFFEPIYKQLKDMQLHKVPLADANEKWKSFLESGTPGLKEESDDKSMIVGIII